jgi:hypothetical protein
MVFEFKLNTGVSSDVAIPRQEISEMILGQSFEGR